jgi:hypothetical protein
MMYGRGKSDSAIVAEKLVNKAGRLAAEPVERRAEAKGNADQQTTCRAQNRESVSQALGRIRQAARQRKKERFTSLLHHISIDLLRLAFFELKRNAAPGVDGLTWQDYEADLERRLGDLHARVLRGAYRALPSQRRYIPKPDGRQRPLAVAALEDKIVQRAVAAGLNAIYEADFLGFSYGFRPKRSQHDALDAMVVGITGRKVNSRCARRPAARQRPLPDAEKFCGRVDEGVAPPHPSQTRMCSFPASGSSWESLAGGGVDDTIRDSSGKKGREGGNSTSLRSRQYSYPLSFRGQVCETQSSLPCFPSTVLSTWHPLSSIGSR